MFSLSQIIIDVKDFILYLKLLLSSGESGQLFHIENRKAVPAKTFYNIKFATDADTLKKEKATAEVKLSDILSSWKRYTHSYGPALLRLDWSNSSSSTTGSWAQKQNDTADENHNVYLSPSAGGWIIDNSTNMIQSTINGVPVAGFISPAAIYDNYMFRCKIDTGWDDDNNGIVVGYTVDSNGREHTLTVMRGFGQLNSNGKYYDPNLHDGSIDTRFWWGLIYDAGNDTQDLIIDLSTTVGTPGWAASYAGNDKSTNYCYLTAIRKGTTITGKTTKFSKDGSDTTDVDAWTFTYTLPTTKPDSMPQEEYDNLKKMLTGRNYIGFCVRSSSKAKFSVVDQDGVFPDQKLYDFTTGNVLEFEKGSSSWKQTGKKISEVLPKNIFVRTKETGMLGFFYGDNTDLNILLKIIHPEEVACGEFVAYRKDQEFIVPENVYILNVNWRVDHYISVQPNQKINITYKSGSLRRYYINDKIVASEDNSFDLTIRWSYAINQFTPDIVL